MSLVYRIIVRLSLVLLPLIMLWASLFYIKITKEINDETDDALENYSELIITRFLANRQLPNPNSGSNSNYNIRQVQCTDSPLSSEIEYYDADVYIPEKDEMEPARILKTIFRNNDGECFELSVSMPTFERDDLKSTILLWIIYLYGILIVTIIIVSILVLRHSMRPLYALLKWFDSYSPGSKNTIVPNNTKDKEFRKLNIVVQQAIDRNEEMYEKQKQFIGNASHELQTPLAVMSNRIDWIIDQSDLTATQLEEMLRLKGTIRNAVRFNKNLLLLTKVDNHQFVDSENVDINLLLKDTIDTLSDIYSYKEIEVKMESSDDIYVQMNESLARILVSNLLKNAFTYSDEHTCINVTATSKGLSVENRGDEMLDKDAIFERFYKAGKQKGSIGLGLAIVKAIADFYGFQVHYSFENGWHKFSINWN